MNNVIKETKKIMEVQPKLQQVFKKVDSYTTSYQSLNRDNQNMQREIKMLKIRNNNLIEENNNLKYYIQAILEAIKRFFRKILQIGNDRVKETTTEEIKQYYDNQDFSKDDVYDIVKETLKEDDLLDYIEYNYDMDRDDFSL